MTYPWASGEVLTAADLNAYAGLVLVTSATATSGTALSVNDCFSAQFSAYRIVVTNLTLASVSGMSMRMRASGTDSTTGTYYSVRNQRDYTGAATSAQGSGATSWSIPLISDTGNAGMTMDVYNPFVAVPTTYSGHGIDSRNAGYGLLNGGGKHDAATSYDGFTIFSAVTISSLTIKVYGYNNG